MKVNNNDLVMEKVENLESEKVLLFWKGMRYQGLLGHEVLRVYLMKEDCSVKSRSKKGTGKISYKKYVDIYSTFRQRNEMKKFMTDEEIFNCPRWIRVNHNFQKDFTEFTNNSEHFVGRGIEISHELFEKVSELSETYFEDALGLRKALCDLFMSNGITIDIDPVVEK